MPTAPDKLEEGVRLERGGLLDRAFEAYRSVVSEGTDPDRVAAALTHESDVHRARCDWDAGLYAARKAQAVAREAGLPKRLADATIAEVNVLMSQGDFGAATMLLTHVVSSASDPRMRGIALQNLGSILAQTGQVAAAEDAFASSLIHFQEAGYVRGEAISLNNSGRLALDTGQCDRAVPLLEEAVRLGRDVEDLELAAMASLNLAAALCQKGQLTRAQDLAMSAYGYFVACKNPSREIECLRLVGQINELCDDCGNATRCYDLALRLATEIGAESEAAAVREKLALLEQRLAGGKGPAQSVAS
jgi:tetratricopeptide (TPR) repeat protein